MINSIIAALEEGQTEEAINMLKRIRDSNRGHQKLGDPSAVVITHPSKTPENIVDAVSFYAAAFGGGNRDASNLRVSAMVTGGDALKVLPDWFKTVVGHMGRDQFVHLMYHTMVELDLVGDKLDTMPLPFDNSEAMLREKLLYNGTIRSITDPLPAHYKQMPDYKLIPWGEQQCQE